MKLEQAARQALEYLDNAAYRSLTDHGEAITALREALAEPDIEEITLTQIAARHEQAEQEPVSLHKVVEEHIADLRACVPTLRQYPEMASMTREVIKAANELEAALKSEQAEQEPVAWFVQYKNRHEFVFGNKPEFIVDGVVEPLYAAPVRTKDLTDDEKLELARSSVGKSRHWLVEAAIAADREKNK